MTISNNSTQALSIDESRDQKTTSDSGFVDDVQKSAQSDVEHAPKEEQEEADFDNVEKPAPTANKQRTRFFGSPPPPFPGDDEFDDNNAAVPYVINEWAQGTSIHGVPFVTDGITWRLWKRSVWIVLVLISSAFMIWQVTNLTEQYRQFDVSTDIHTLDPTSIQFPQVTICNTNMFSKTRMEKYGIPDPTQTEELLKLLTPLDEFVVKTWFNGFELNSSEVWKPTMVLNYGQCWNFQTDQKVSRPGYFGGLKVWADLRQWDYENYTTFAGAVIFTEQNGTLVTPHLDFNTANPGKESFVTLQSVEFNREREEPWTHCKGEAPHYTPVRCRVECGFAAVRERCGCRLYSDTHEDAKNYRICRRRVDPADEACVAETVAKDEELVQECSCTLPACSHTDYSGHVTEVDFADVYLANLDYDSLGIDQAYLLKNLVSVTINFGKIQYQHFTESKAMSFAELLGAIGGSMGLFLGISLLSVFELVGDLGMMRLIPRCFGHRHLLGLGARKHKND